MVRLEQALGVWVLARKQRVQILFDKISAIEIENSLKISRMGAQAGKEVELYCSHHTTCSRRVVMAFSLSSRCQKNNVIFRQQLFLGRANAFHQPLLQVA